MALAGSDEQLIGNGGARLKPAPVVTFTANTTAVQLSVAATAYANGFLVVNRGAVTLYLGDASVGATGVPLLAGQSIPIGSADASLWYAYAASSCVGSVQGMVVA